MVDNIKLSPQFAGKLLLVVVWCLPMVELTRRVSQDLVARPPANLSMPQQQVQLTPYGNKAINGRLPPLPRMPKDIGEALELILEARTALGQRASFVQVGANNGVMFDPLYPHLKNNKPRWLGLQVEPQPELYGAVSVLHADAEDWAFYHGALALPEACQNGTIKFCETKTPGVGGFKTQGQLNGIKEKCDGDKMHYQQRPCVSSFDDLIYRHATPTFLKHLMEEMPVAAQGDLIKPKRRYFIDHLQIDVESHDYDVLTLIDFDQLFPICIAYEQQGLGKNKLLAMELVKSMNYTTIALGMDVLACQVVANHSLPL